MPFMIFWFSNLINVVHGVSDLSEWLRLGWCTSLVRQQQTCWSVESIWFWLAEWEHIWSSDRTSHKNKTDTSVRQWGLNRKWVKCRSLEINACMRDCPLRAWWHAWYVLTLNRLSTITITTQPMKAGGWTLETDIQKVYHCSWRWR